MKMKNDDQRDYIKEAFDKLYNCVMPYIDLTQISDASAAFNELDKKLHSEIYILKKCLDERDRAVEAGLARSTVDRRMISDLEQRLNDERKHGEDFADINGRLASENVDLKAKLTLLETSRITWRSRAQHAEKEINTLKKKIHELEEENSNLRVTTFDTLEALKKENSELKTSNERLNTKRKSYLKELFEARIEAAQYKKRFMEHHEENNRLRDVIDGRDNEIHDLEKKIQDLEEENASLTEDVDALVAENTDLHTRLSSYEKLIENLEKSNSILKRDGKTLWARLEECDIPKREQDSYKSLVEAIEFQNKKIEKLEAEKARLKEAYDIHETTTKKENIDLSPGHEFKFGDEVFVPWSDGPYMYVKSGLMYNPRTERLVYVGKDQHLKWFGDKFSIV